MNGSLLHCNCRGKGLLAFLFVVPPDRDVQPTSRHPISIDTPSWDGLRIHHGPLALQLSQIPSPDPAVVCMLIFSSIQ